MGLIEIFLIGISLAMDAFAVSICKGLSIKELKHVTDSQDIYGIRQNLNNKIKEINPDIKVLTRVTSPIIATHAGSGAYAVFYTTEDF